MDEKIKKISKNEYDIDFENSLKISSKSYITKEDLTAISDYFKIEYSKNIIRVCNI